MRWLLHGTITPAAALAMHRHEQKTKTPPEIDLPIDASAEQILQAAHKSQLEILTSDAAFANALYEQRLPFSRCIVLLNVPTGDVEQDDAIDRLFARYKRLTPGRLYTVTESRVKIRQLPTNRS